MVAICFTLTVAVLLSFIGLGSPVAFNSVVSLTVNGLYASYLIGNTLLLWRRVTGGIKPYSASDTTLTNTVEAGQLTWGPWKIREPFGTIVNALGCAYLLVMVIFSFWPIGNHPGPATMNYSSLMCGSVAIFSVVYYVCWGKRVYTGPVIEVSNIIAR